MAVVVPTWAVLTISHVAVAYLAFRFGMAHYRTNYAPGDKSGVAETPDKDPRGGDDLGAASADDLDEYEEEELR